MSLAVRYDYVRVRPADVEAMVMEIANPVDNRKTESKSQPESDNPEMHNELVELLNTDKERLSRKAVGELFEYQATCRVVP